ncbi:argininosuccinate synthase [Catellatospora sp. KI3]|uniref:argininosuccinate synthase domain-containing protein n=1 Tax=Catellatospora sp. KI3 TaxID=3041620 RepID=UPI0024822C26|nr:argininosuccinate synthase domain-containing protein [Catellatospora sp. KI3]MDI1462546.1 argininosuccinate synthase [Catellatospora sp. KI3]
MRHRELAGQHVGVFQAGGLSSLALGVWLRDNGIASHHYVADIGQHDDGVDGVVAGLRAHGFEATAVDLRPSMAAMGLRLLRHQARHDGGYWNTTGASRHVLVEGLVGRMRADGCTVLAHGCVGGGNDQRRFAAYGRAFAPDLPVFAPWTDPDALARFPGRKEMLAAVEHAGLPLDEGSDADRSTDANLAGASHESTALEDLANPVGPRTLRPRWSAWPAEAPERADTVTVTFTDGEVTDVDGSGPDPVRVLTTANDLGARHGIWLRDVVERRIIGTRCRGVYEAPGLEVLDVAWQRALEVCLDPHAQALYRTLAPVLGAAVYEARHEAAAPAAARLAMDELTRAVTATVQLSLHQGRARAEGIEAPGTGGDQQTRFGSGGNRWHDPSAN